MYAARYRRVHMFMLQLRRLAYEVRRLWATLKAHRLPRTATQQDRQFHTWLSLYVWPVARRGIQPSMPPA